VAKSDALQLPLIPQLNPCHVALDIAFRAGVIYNSRSSYLDSLRRNWFSVRGELAELPLRHFSYAPE